VFKKVAIGVAALSMSTSAFVIGGAKIAHAVDCTSEYFQGTSTTSVDGYTVTLYLEFYYVYDAGQESCSHFDSTTLYSRYQTSGGLGLRVGSWDNPYAYTIAYIDGQGYLQPFGAKWNGYSGCAGISPDIFCTSGQYQSPWIEVLPNMSGLEGTLISDYYNGGPFDASQVEDVVGTHFNLTEATANFCVGCGIILRPHGFSMGTT
jgi:hypothetical protein